MRRRAFDAEHEDDNYEIAFNLNPNRWIEIPPDADNPISNESNWSPEIKYLNVDGTQISDEIKNIPQDTGGVYIFYIKGIWLPFTEKYIVYVGRCQYTEGQNIRKRANEYFTEKRPLIKKMFKQWKDCLYYRYFPDTDNERIKKNEALLIHAIKPEFNEDIPTVIDIQPLVNAF